MDIAMPNSRKNNAADAEFSDGFWEGFHGPKTLSNVMRHFVTSYPGADTETRNVFAHMVMQSVIMKSIDRRKLDELIEQEASKIDIADISENRDGPAAEKTGMSIFQADRLDGQSFQDFVAEILRHAGYTDVEVTGKSGDQGGDILAERDGQSIVIQAKRYSVNRRVSNTAVQEAHGAKSYYTRDVGAVITNTLYTKSAKSLAEKTGVILWDRKDLTELIARYNDAQNS